MAPPLAIDLFCGLGGWAEGLLAEGYDVIGFDIERHRYGAHRYPAALVLQDVLTLHGAQLRDAALIVASPPCQEYSFMAMPWARAKAKAAAIRADDTGQALADLNRLFDVCFRLQAQASLAAGRRVPLVVENVRGAQPWVGRARWNFGSYYLWGDVPALMPILSRSQPGGGTGGRASRSGAAPTCLGSAGTGFAPGASWAKREAVARREGYKSAGLDWSDPSKRGQDFTRRAGDQARGIKSPGLLRHAARREPHWTNSAEHSPAGPGASTTRKEASALIAKIPALLARHVGAVYRRGGG
jgi:C-5 cytosine-specific DNA methylase